VQDMSAKINDVLSNKELKEDLIKRGYERVKIYNWCHTAEKTLDVFNQVLGLNYGNEKQQ